MRKGYLCTAVNTASGMTAPITTIAMAWNVPYVARKFLQIAWKVANNAVLT